MTVLTWVSILAVLVTLYCIVKIIPLAKKEKSSYLILLSLALTAYLGSNITYVVDENLINPLRWFNFTALVCSISSLFGLIRSSKPVFARFPGYLIYLPFLTLLFFPLVVHQTVITNLLVGTFQAGCIIVALMMYGINQYKNQKSIPQIVGVSLFLISFSIFWFAPLNSELKTVSSELLLIAGLLSLIAGIKNKFKNNLNE